MKRQRIGQPAPGKLPVYDHRGNMRGVVGPRATSATAARFGVGHGATLKVVKGRRAWVGRKPGKPQASALPLSTSLRTSKGSVTHTPTAPEVHARPHR